MQIAAQVFGVDTAVNACILFADGEPAYDLICTSLHFPYESPTARELLDDLETDSFRQNAFYKCPDFLQLAGCYGIPPERARCIIDRFADCRKKARDFIDRSCLSAPAKADYAARFHDRLKALAD